MALQEKKLIFGLLFSLKRFMNGVALRPVRDGFYSYRTSCAPRSCVA